MIVKTQDLPEMAMAYILWCIEGGSQHRGHSGMYFFKRNKLEILKNNWRPWEVKAQAAELLEGHQLCVWHDFEGWHAGSYGATPVDSVFFDAPTMSIAVCLAVIGKHCGERVNVPNEMMVSSRRKPNLMAALLAQSNTLHDIRAMETTA